MNPKDVEPRMKAVSDMMKAEAPKGDHAAIDAVTQLVGGALVDLGRVANALELIALGGLGLDRGKERLTSVGRR